VQEKKSEQAPLPWIGHRNHGRYAPCNSLLLPDKIAVGALCRFQNEKNRITNDLNAFVFILYVRIMTHAHALITEELALAIVKI
jgi:hypothetical protein